jgi:1-acyl-sn-glycerol-3-phosphate acyltransferase
MLAATAIGLVGFPVLAPLAVGADMLRGRRRLPTLRVYLFLLQYGVNDSAEILIAPLLWARAGFGATATGPASLARYDRVQWWSAELLERRARQLLGLRIELDEADRQRLTPGPVIVLSRHVSLFDASLPGLILRRLGFRVRAVIMAELLADPGFDLIYTNTGSVFIPRDRGPQARAAIADMAHSIDPGDRHRTAVLIFPEGRLFRPPVRDRLLARLAETDPARSARLAGLRRLLPPRPGGVLALLDALPDADVVVLDHRGLDQLTGVARLIGTAPVADPVVVTVHRVARSDIPAGPDERVAWLDRLWLDLDDALADHSS